MGHGQFAHLIWDETDDPKHPSLDAIFTRHQAAIDYLDEMMVGEPDRVLRLERRHMRAGWTGKRVPKNTLARL